MNMSKSSIHSELTKLVDREVYAGISRDGCDVDSEETVYQAQSVSNDWWWTEVHERRQKEKKLANRIRAIKNAVGRTAKNLFVRHEPWDPSTRPLPAIPKGELPRELALGRLYLDLCSSKESKDSPKRRRQSYRNDIKRALWRLTNCRPISNIRFPVVEPLSGDKTDEIKPAESIGLLEPETQETSVNSDASTGDSATTRPMSSKRTPELSDKKLRRIHETIQRWEREAYKDLTGREMNLDNQDSININFDDLNRDETLSNYSLDDELNQENYHRSQQITSRNKRKRVSMIIESAKNFIKQPTILGNHETETEYTENYNTHSVNSAEPLLRSDRTSRDVPYMSMSEQDFKPSDNFNSPSGFEELNNDNSYVTHWDMETRGFKPVEDFEETLKEKREFEDAYISHEDMEIRNSQPRGDFDSKDKVESSDYLRHEELDLGSISSTNATSLPTDKTSCNVNCDFSKLHSGYIAWKRLNKLKNRRKNKYLKERDSNKRLPQAWRWLAFIERKFDIEFEDSSEDDIEFQPNLSSKQGNRQCRITRRYSFGDAWIGNLSDSEEDLPHSDTEDPKKKKAAIRRRERDISALLRESERDSVDRETPSYSSEQATSTLKLPYNRIGSEDLQPSRGRSERPSAGEEWISLSDWLDKEQPARPTKPIPRYEAFDGDHDFSLLYDLVEIKRRFGHPQYRGECSEEIKSLVSRAINAIYLRCLCKMRDRMKEKQESKRLETENGYNDENHEEDRGNSLLNPNLDSEPKKLDFRLLDLQELESGIQVESTFPINDQIPDEDGLIKPVSVFQKPNYVENYVQSILDACGPIKTLVLGGEVRYFSRKALETTVMICAGNQVDRLIIPSERIMTSATASHLIRKYKTNGGIILTGGSWPAGRDGYFGIRYYDETGANASEKTRKKIAEKSNKIREFRVYKTEALSKESFKESSVVGRTILEVVDATKSYIELLEGYLPLDMIHYRLFKPFHKTHSEYRPEWRILVDCRHGATGPFVQALFRDRFQIPQEFILHTKPLCNFGGYDPVPNATTAADFIRRVQKQKDVRLGIAFSANGERCLVVTKAGPLTMCDLASAIARLTPLVSQRDLKSHVALKGASNHVASCNSYSYARTYASSSILERMATRYGLTCQIVPTASHFWCLMEEGKADLCCDENFGIAFNHLRELDSMFAALMMLYLAARGLKDLDESLEWVWQDFGRDYILRHDFTDIEYSRCELWAKHLYLQLNLKMALNQKYGKNQEYLCTDCGPFDYRNPLTDCWEQYNFPIQATFNHRSRICFKIIRTGKATGSVSVWANEWSKEYNHDNNKFLESLMNVAYDLGKIEFYLERSRPDVIA